MFAITHSCNLNCSICYLPSQDISEITLEDIKRFISNFDGPNIRFAGGEPTLREDLIEMICFTRSMGKSTLLITNGLKLTDRNYVKELKKAGLQLACLSFNGLSDEVYRKINGRPLLKIKLEALQNLMKEKIKIVLSVMLVKGVNEDEFKNIYRLYIKNLRYFYMLRIRTAVCSGRYNSDQEQIYLSDIVKMISKTTGISYNDLIDFYY